MAEDKSEPFVFKVVDRRTFSTDGNRRESVPEEEKKPDARPAGAPGSSTPRQAEAEDYAEAGPVDFSMLVSYLSTTAMFQLGLLPGPSGERIPADMQSAQRTIDLLEVLQEKTQGNLTSEEVQLLDDVLYELRISFVEVQKHHAKKGQ